MSDKKSVTDSTCIIRSLEGRDAREILDSIEYVREQLFLVRDIAWTERRKKIVLTECIGLLSDVKEFLT